MSPSSSPSYPTGGRLNRTALRKIEFAIVLLYSLAVMGSAIPFFADISNVPVILYYLLVPGYCVTGLFGEHYAVVPRILFSGLISIALVLSIYSLRQTVLVGIHLPYDLLVPVLTLIVLLFNYYHPKR